LFKQLICSVLWAIDEGLFRLIMKSPGETEPCLGIFDALTTK